MIREKISIFSIIVVLITYVFYDYVLAPQWTHIDELNGQYTSEQQQVKVIKNFVAAHPNQEAFLTELDNKLIHVANLFPDNPEISTALLQFEQLSRDCGVQLNYLKPTKITNREKEGYRDFELEFSINGTFAHNMDFLNKAEHGLRFANITSIAMQLNKKDLESKITAKVYSYGVPAAPASITPTPATPLKAADPKNPAPAAPVAAPPIPNANATK